MRSPEPKRKYREKDHYEQVYKPVKYMLKEKKETRQDQPRYVEKVEKAEKIDKEKEETKPPQIEEPQAQTSPAPFDPERRE